MCAKTLDILSKVVYIKVDPDLTKEELDQKIEIIRTALVG